MAKDSKKEALFNEVKGSLFEYLLAKEVAVRGKDELAFQRSLDQNYLHVLGQQDRMVRQFYPEMLPFLLDASKRTADALVRYFGEVPSAPKVVGKFSNSSLSSELHEADLVFSASGKTIPLSLKLNKKNAFVNTKSGGIKSFFSQYFSYVSPDVQGKFNLFVDREFERMAGELHALHDLEYPGHFGEWVRKGFSELPGELDEESRSLLKRYYSRIAEEMHRILSEALQVNRVLFVQSLPPLLGFGFKEILQVIFFHDFPSNEDPQIDIHSFSEIESDIEEVKIRAFGNISSVELEMGNVVLQVRVKPMNKFTTTAIKINCSVRIKRPSVF